MKTQIQVRLNTLKWSLMIQRRKLSTLKWSLRKWKRKSRTQRTLKLE